MVSQVLELVIFAGLAGVVLFMLYSVLGRRVGRQPQEGFGPVRLKMAEGRAGRAAEEVAIEVQHPGLAAIKARDPGFELPKFLDNARGAYQDIVKAFVGGDRAALRSLTAPEVLDAWEPAIAAREGEGSTESVEFVHPPRADLEEADVTGALAKLKVRFLAELRSIVKRGGEETSADRRTAEIWTFERPLDGREQGWTLARVDAAEADLRAAARPLPAALIHSRLGLTPRRGVSGSVLAAVLLVLAACAPGPRLSPPTHPTSPHGAPRPAPWRPSSPSAPASTGDYPAPSRSASEALTAIPGWSEDDHAAALAAFAAGCGVARDPAMRGPCQRARAMGASASDATARAFFEREFRAEPLTGEGVLTAYFAPEYAARRAPEGAYTAPVRGKPDAAVLTVVAQRPPAAPPPPDVIDRVLSGADEGAEGDASSAPALSSPTSGSGTPAAPVPYSSLSAPRGPVALARADRAAIETAPAPDALAWMRPEDLFFLQIQGSGTLVFPDGAHAKATYAADNGKPFVAIARPMVAQGLLAPGRASGDGIRAWLATHAGPHADAVMRLNPRYVFFAVRPDDGREPAGAAGVPLPAGRSLAVDPSRHAYGELYWIDASAPVLTGATRRYRRLAMALDTGSAIRGEVRADLYIGRGGAAGDEAGRVRHTLRMIRLVPVGGG